MSTAAATRLQAIIDFVNTRDIDDGVDHVTTAGQLQSWIAEHDLAPANATLDARDVGRAAAVREALRTILVAHHADAATDADGASAPEIEAANAVLASVPLHLHFSAAGTTSLQPAGTGIDAALGQLLAAIPAAAADGTWERTKICPSGDCQWAFYDESRNRSRRWCSMEVCGNREKSKTFRARHTSPD